jgi:hypothetical protein
MVDAAVDVEPCQVEAAKVGVKVGDATLDLDDRSAASPRSRASEPRGATSTVARFNPVNWAVEAGREAPLATPDWSLIVPRFGGLVLFAVVYVGLATQAFRSYQRAA